MAKRKNTKRASKKAAKGSGKTRKKASKKSAPRPRKALGATRQPQKVTPIDLNQALCEHGLSEEIIPLIWAFMSFLADSISRISPSPTQVSCPPGSPEEDDRAKIARAVSADLKQSRERTKKVISLGRANKINGMRETLWQLELNLLRGLPRVSYVGRAIHENTAPKAPGVSNSCNYAAVFNTISKNNAALLSADLQEKLKILRDGSAAKEPRDKRSDEKSATSALTKNLGRRVEVLISDLKFAEKQKSRAAETYTLTDKGRKVFDNWPDWHR